MRCEPCFGGGARRRRDAEVRHCRRRDSRTRTIPGFGRSITVNVNGEFTEKVLKTFRTMTPALPKSPWCNVTLAGVECAPTVCGAALAHEATAIVGVLPGREFPLKSLGWSRRAIEIADERAERHSIVDGLCGHDVLLWDCGNRTAAGRSRRRRSFGRRGEGLFGRDGIGAGRLVEAVGRGEILSHGACRCHHDRQMLQTSRRVRPGRSRSSARPKLRPCLSKARRGPPDARSARPRNA